MAYQEIEVRFLEIDKDALIARLNALGAEDLGETLLDEQIIYDESLSWIKEGKRALRLRTKDGETTLTYKNHREASADGVEEVEFAVSDAGAAEALLERLGYPAYRHQQKKRHTFQLGEVTIDIDTWPRIPTYVELEGSSVEALQEAARALGFDWEKAELRNPRRVIEEVYNIPVGTLRWFTFDRFE
ncbi:MAG TPA: class IV adenylate cyclase [Candidatus Paceibacterota bacterium]